MADSIAPGGSDRNPAGYDQALASIGTPVSPNPFLLEHHDLVLGHARIGDLTFGYAQARTKAGGLLHWYVAVDDHGARLAMPFAVGELVPGKPRANVDEIQAHLASIAKDVTAPTDKRMILAVRQGVQEGNENRLTATLVELGVRIRTSTPWLVRAAINEALGPVCERLGKRLDLLRGYDLARSRSQRIRHGARKLDPMETMARILRSTEAEAEALARFKETDEPLLELALEMDGIVRDAAPAEIRRSLLTALGLPPAVVRRIPEDGGIAPNQIRLLRVLPVDWVPAADDKEEWRALSFAAAIAEASALPDEAWPSLVAGSKGQWSQFVGRCARGAFGPLRRPERTLDLAYYLTRPAAQTLDVTQAFAIFVREVSRETGLAAELAAAEIAKEAVLGDRGLPALLENSRLWHSRFREDAPAGVTWKAVLPRWTHPDTGIEVVPLTSSDELATEGSPETGLDHCVGGAKYALTSLRDEVRIVSLRKDGQPLSTAEISLRGDEADSTLPQEVVQHQARGNSKPPEEAIQALEAYVSLDGVRQAARKAQANEDRLPERTYAETVQALERWRPFLTGNWKNATLGDFRSALLARLDDEPVLRMAR